VTDGIKILAEIRGNDSNIGVGSKERGDYMKDGNKGSSGGASRMKRKLIMKGKCGWGCEKNCILVRIGVMEIQYSTTNLNKDSLICKSDNKSVTVDKRH